MASASFTLDGGSPLVKASVASGAAVAVALDSLDGVESVLWEVASTDESTTAGAFTIADSTATSTTITVPSTTTGLAAIVRCTVNGGQQVNPTTGATESGDLVKTAKLYVETPSQRELIAAGEQTESDATFGWTGLVNRAIDRRVASGAMTTTLIVPDLLETSDATPANLWSKTVSTAGLYRVWADVYVIAPTTAETYTLAATWRYRSGTLTQQGTTTTVSSEGAGTYTVALDDDGAGTIRIRCTGVIATAVDWYAVIHYTFAGA